MFHDVLLEAAFWGGFLILSRTAASLPRASEVFNTNVHNTVEKVDRMPVSVYLADASAPCTVLGAGTLVARRPL